MENIALSISNISKYYKLDIVRDARLLEALAYGIKKTFRSRKKKEEINGIWALKNINLQINKGDIVGIIGRNGSGKSTLLKIISEVTEPTSGEIIINGSLASVLEIGMGFHVDLTGRENIYQSGQIMGFSRQDIKENIDAIISFSGLEQFIDTPIKYYSSGMYIRLAFSIVTNIKADILLFDEVLSVGDAEFRLKSQKKIQELISNGRTVVIVTHSSNEVINLCNRAVIMEQGLIKDEGDTLSIIAKYNEDMFNLSMEKEVKIRNSVHEEFKEEEEQKLQEEEQIEEIFIEEINNEEIITKTEFEIEQETLMLQQIAEELEKAKIKEKELIRIKNLRNFIYWDKIEEAPGNDNIKFQKIEVHAFGKSLTNSILKSDDIVVNIDFWNTYKNNTSVLGFSIIDNIGNVVFGSTPFHYIKDFEFESSGFYHSECIIPAGLLNDGSFVVEVVIMEEGVGLAFNLRRIVTFKVNNNDNYSKNYLRLPGPITPQLNWSVEKMNEIENI